MYVRSWNRNVGGKSEKYILKNIFQTCRLKNMYVRSGSRNVGEKSEKYI